MKSISKLICLFLTMSIFITMSGYAAQNHTAYINENEVFSSRLQYSNL